MVSDEHKQNLATTTTIINVVSGLVNIVENPETPINYRNVAIEHKVASSLRKKLAKHLVRAE